MTDLLFKLLGLPSDDFARVADAELRFRGGLGVWWMVLLGVCLVALTIGLYRRTAGELAPRRRYVLTVLRCGFLLGLVIVLMKPVLQFTIEGSIRRAMLVLVDDSASMKIADERTDDDLKRAAMAQDVMDATRGLEQDLAGTAGAAQKPARIDLVRAMLGNPKVNLLPRLADSFDLRPYRFGSSLTEMSLREGAAEGQRVPLNHWLRRLQAEDPSTRLGDSLREVLGRSRGQPLAGIVLVTDGVSNIGGLPLAAADLARQQGVPLYVYGVGITSPRELAITSLFAQETAFYDDEVPVTLRVRSRGLAGLKSKLTLQLVPKAPTGAAAEQSIEQEVSLEDGEQVISLSITPTRRDESERSQDYNLVATLEPTGQEAVRDNLSHSQSLRVIDGKIKVLFVEQQPRWEYRYLQAQLMRDRRVSLKTVLLDAAAGIARDPNGPYLPAIPERREDLFEYDLIILGDLNPQALPVRQMGAIEEFVSRFGGGLLIIAGRNNELSQARGTPLEKLLPVEIESSVAARPGPAPRGQGTRPVRLELTGAGTRSTLLRLAGKEADNAAIWAELPPIYWTAQVARAKPAAEVLLVDADPDHATRLGKMPVFALHQYGQGQVFFSGTDNTWRWRRGTGEEHYITLWSQIVQRLALPKLLGESKRTQLSSDRQAYATGERVTVYARLYEADYTPIQREQVEATYRSGSGAEGRVVLRQDGPGVFRGEFIAPRPGSYELTVETDAATKLAFDVGEPRLETSETGMNQALLEQMAIMTGGVFYREETLYQLPEQVKQKTERIRSTVDFDIWSSPLVFILLMMLVTLEWVMRKLWQLK